jgi:5S rRNA maturation endonuclease (ribonuclease M5)
MHPSTLRALKRAAELTRQNRFTEAVLIAEPVILTADDAEGAEIRRWLTEHVQDFISHKEAS